MFRIWWFSLAALFIASMPHVAAAATITDDYWGGTDPRKASKQSDVVGDKKVFDTKSMDVTRDAAGRLVVTVNTNFAGMSGTSKALGYGYGALFFSTTGVTLSGSAADHYGSDKYTAGRFDYAFAMPTNPGKKVTTGTFGAGSTEGGLFKLDDSEVRLSAPLKKGHQVRKGQAVQFVNNDKAETSVAGGSWTIDKLNKTISFIIDDGGLLGTDFAVSWAMTCGNDVIIGEVELPGGGPGPGPDPVPLPAGAFLFMTGAAALGLLKRRRRSATPNVAL